MTPLCASVRMMGFLLTLTVHYQKGGALKLHNEASPVEKAMGLLRDLQAKLEVQGKKEAVSYDKYTCFCKEQTQTRFTENGIYKNYIEKINGFIQEKEAESVQLNAELAKAVTAISEIEARLNKGSRKRDKEHQGFLITAEDYEEAIQQCLRAMGSIDAFKDAIQNEEFDFSQVSELTSSMLAKFKHANGAAAQASLKALLALSQTEQKPHAYKVSAGTKKVKELLRQLVRDFRTKKQELELEDIGKDKYWGYTKLQLRNMIKKHQRAKEQYEDHIQRNVQFAHKANNVRADYQANLARNDALIDEMKVGCEEKANLWDQRSETRSAEVKIITQTIEQLEKGVLSKGAFMEQQSNQEKEPAGKQIQAPTTLDQELLAAADADLLSSALLPSVAFIQTHQRDSSSFLTRSVAPIGLPIFLQVHREGHRTAAGVGTAAKQRAAARRAQRALAGAASKLNSDLLMNMAVKADAMGDHFVKVREMIKGLMERLSETSNEDASHHSFCVRAFEQGEAERKKAHAKALLIEAKTAKLKADMKTEERKAAQLAEELASLQHSLNEAVELRAQDRQENNEALGIAKECKAGTELAMSILQGFYQGGSSDAFMQVSSVAEKAPKAPKTFKEKYTIQKESADSIISLLNMVLADFQRTVALVTKQEEEEQATFKKFEQDTTKEKDLKTHQQEQAEARITEIKDQIIEETSSLSEEDDVEHDAEASVEEIRQQCTEAKENYQLRDDQRQKEIAALKDALLTLEEWQR